MNLLIFSSHSMKNIWYLPKKSKYPLCHKNRITIRITTLWRTHVTSLTLSMSIIRFLISAPLQNKDTTGARPRVRTFVFARERDQNVQFLRLGSFLVTTRDRGFILGIHLNLGKTNRNQ